MLVLNRPGLRIIGKLKEKEALRRCAAFAKAFHLLHRLGSQPFAHRDIVSQSTGRLLRLTYLTKRVAPRSCSSA